jgi:hypothetical protein
MASLNSPQGKGAGAAELNWPDREQFTVNLVPSRIQRGFSLSVPGAPGQAKTEQQALAIATTYAERHAAWALSASQATATALDQDTNIGWLVSWRRWRGPVLMPMRLDIQIEPSGRITDLIQRDISDPELPTVHYTESQAWSAFYTKFNIAPTSVRRADPTLLAVRRDNGWGVDWLLGAESDDDIYSVSVDAVTGNIHNASQQPRSSEDAGASTDNVAP